MTTLVRRALRGASLTHGYGIICCYRRTIILMEKQTAKGLQRRDADFGYPAAHPRTMPSGTGSFRRCNFILTVLIPYGEIII